jgi:hypothetical protein
MPLHCPHAQVQARGDLLVAEAFGDKREHAEFTLAQLGELILRRRLGGTAQGAHLGHQALGVVLEHLDDELVHRADVVVSETIV